jgi:hypothetical protein
MLFSWRKNETSACVLIAACAVGMLYYLRDFYFDDAYIVLRYSENFLNGHGFVWNPDEYVEGYTSFLWLALCTAFGGLTGDLVLGSRLLGVLSLAGIVIVLVRSEGWAGWLASILLCTCGTVVAWALGGLETLTFSLLLTLCTIRFAHCRPGEGWIGMAATGVIAGLCQLCRPEAGMLLFLGIAYVVVRRCRDHRQRIESAAAIAIPFLLIAGAHLIWRYFYYGDWAPNTYYVKMPAYPFAHLSIGLAYVASFAVYQCVPLAVAVFLLVWRWRAADESLLFQAGVVAAFAAYVTYVGGVHGPWFRFCAPLVPLLYLVIAQLLLIGGNSPSINGSRVAIIGFLAIFNVGVTVYYGEKDWPGDRPWKLEHIPAFNGELTGIFMRDNWPAHSLVALNTAGSTAFFSKLSCIDMLGLCDRHIARSLGGPDPKLPTTRLIGHMKGDGEYVLGREPDFIILGGAEGSSIAVFKGDDQILDHQSFKKEYEYESRDLAAADGSSEFTFQYFRRRSTSPQAGGQ